MAKFLFFLPRFHTNAVPWVRILKEAGHDVEVHCMIRRPSENYGLVTPRIHEPSPWSLRLGGCERNDRRLFPRLFVVWRAIRGSKADIVIARGLTRWFMRMAALVALLQGKTLVVYDQEEPNSGHFNTRMRRAFCSLVGIRHFTPKIDIREAHTTTQASQIPFGCAFSSEIATKLSRRELGWPPRVLMVAKYRDRKRHRDLLRALAKLAHTHNFSLTLCGEEVTEEDRGFCHKLRGSARELGIGTRLSFKNNIPHGEMVHLYAEHDVFVLPAVNEPAAVSPLEAVWCGCVAVMARGSGTRPYLPPSNRFDFDDGDVDDLARVLRGMLGDPAVLEEARDLCVDRLSELADDARILEHFESLLPSDGMRGKASVSDLPEPRTSRKPVTPAAGVTADWEARGD